MMWRGCKGIGGIYWDEMVIKEGIVLCKCIGELVGFEDLNISVVFNIRLEDLNVSDEYSNSFFELIDNFDLLFIVFD